MRPTSGIGIFGPPNGSARGGGCLLKKEEGKKTEEASPRECVIASHVFFEPLSPPLADSVCGHVADSALDVDFFLIYFCLEERKKGSEEKKKKKTRPRRGSQASLLDLDLSFPSFSFEFTRWRGTRSGDFTRNKRTRDGDRGGWGEGTEEEEEGNRVFSSFV